MENVILKRFPGANILYILPDESIQRKVLDCASEFDIVVACGGDGTVSEVAKALIGTKTILGVVPIGSGNDFAKSIGLGDDLAENLDVLFQEKISRIDVIETKSGSFINTFGMGVDGLTNYYASNSKFKSGWLRYFLGGLKAMCTSNPFILTYQDNHQQLREKVWMAVIANGKFEGGRYLISPNSKNNDGIFEVVLVKNITRIRLLVEFLKAAVGLPFSESVVKRLSASECSFTTSIPQKIHADGECIPYSSEFHFRMRKRELQVISAL